MGLARGFVLVVSVVVLGATLASARADACTTLIPDDRFFLTEAPPGGVWWLHGWFPLGPDEAPLEQVPLERDDGVVLQADVVSRGNAAVALAVPEGAAAGDRFLLPEGVVEPFDERSPLGALVVVEGSTAPPVEPVPEPDVRVTLREDIVGWESAVVVPWGDMCSFAPGLWNMHYGERPFVFAIVPEGFVLDMTVRPEGEGAFDPATSLNQVVFDGVAAGTYEARLQPSPESFDEGSREALFQVHARLRRVADGAPGPVVTETVGFDRDDDDVRLEWVGCGASGGAASPMFALGFALLALRGRPRRRR